MAFQSLLFAGIAGIVSAAIFFFLGRLILNPATRTKGFVLLPLVLIGILVLILGYFYYVVPAMGVISRESLYLIFSFISSSLVGLVFAGLVRLFGNSNDNGD